MGSGRMRARKGRGPIARVPNGSALRPEPAFKLVYNYIHKLKSCLVLAAMTQ
jgi:hypothetical protein